MGLKGIFCCLYVASVVPGSTLWWNHLLKHSKNTFVRIYEVENVTTATKANEPIFCQLKCHSENLSHHKSSVSSGKVTDQKWKCHCGISSQLTGPSTHLSWKLFSLQCSEILKNPTHIQKARFKNMLTLYSQWKIAYFIFY